MPKGSAELTNARKEEIILFITTLRRRRRYSSHCSNGSMSFLWMT